MSDSFAVTSEVLTPQVKSKLVKVSRKSVIRHRHAAVCIDETGRPYSYKCNFKGPRNHAEVRSYEHFMRRYATQGKRISFLLVVRVNNQDELRYSEPCKSCANYFKNKNIPIFYSTGEERDTGN